MKMKKRKETMTSVTKTMSETRDLQQRLISRPAWLQTLRPCRKKSKKSGAASRNLSTCSSSRNRSGQHGSRPSYASRSCRTRRTRRRSSCGAMNTAVTLSSPASSCTPRNLKSLLKKRGKSRLSSNSSGSKKKGNCFNHHQLPHQATWGLLALYSPHMQM